MGSEHRLASWLTICVLIGMTVSPAFAQQKKRAAPPIPAAATQAPEEKQETKKPNILFIMGDDIGWMQPSIY